MGNHKHKKEKSSKKEHKESSREHKKHKKSSRQKDDEIDYSDPSLWVEAEDNAEMTPAEYLRNQQQNTDAKNNLSQETIEQPMQENARHGWMLDSGFDFGSLGTARQKEEDKSKPNPDEPKISSRELNRHLVQGLSTDEIPQQKPSIRFGDAGSNWRMMKLKRTKEQAEDEGRPLWEVGIERYGSAEKFQEALDEREYLDNRKRSRTDDRQRNYDDRRRDRRDNNKRSSLDDRRKEQHEQSDDGGRRFMFTNNNPVQRTFRRPEPPKRQRSPTPEPERRQPELKKEPEPANTQTPVPTPPIYSMPSVQQVSSVQPLTRDQLNKLNAKLVKARLIGADNVAELEKEYEEELQRFEQAQKGVTVLPTFDSQGRLHDYALNQKSQQPEELKGKKKYEGTHDRVTGERIRYGTADDTLSLVEMVRQEKAGGRSFDMDMEFANRIVSDASFENNLDYMDEKADIIASKKGQTEEQKMKRAITDYKRTQDALERCRFCYHDDKPPQLAMVSLAATCYLALPNVHELTPGHCMIVPLQHVTSMLECDDDVWTEVRNFQKCLMKMFHEQNRGTIFMETVVNLRSHRHTVIEAIPVPYDVYDDAPAYFREAIMSSEEEWSQHKKLIDTTERGFRRSMVKNLPYFHVWFGLDKGYGHVIENTSNFPYWFGKEVIAGMMDIGPELWRRPKFYDYSVNPHRQEEFLKSWEKWDWTSAL